MRLKEMLYRLYLKISRKNIIEQRTIQRLSNKNISIY